MDSMIDRPWNRTEFLHSNLTEWVMENRPQLVWASLTIVQS